MPTDNDIPPATAISFLSSFNPSFCLFGIACPFASSYMRFFQGQGIYSSFQPPQKVPCGLPQHEYLPYGTPRTLRLWPQGQPLILQTTACSSAKKPLPSEHQHPRQQRPLNHNLFHLDSKRKGKGHSAREMTGLRQNVGSQRGHFAESAFLCQS